MGKHLEIEYKNLLNKQEFQMILDHFSVRESDFFTQVNHYFDTRDFFLKTNSCALRIRRVHGDYELTLKRPAKRGLLEITDSLSAQSANAMLDGAPLPEGEVKSELASMNAPIKEIVSFGELTTKRAEIPYKGGLLVFDKSTYLGATDYEMEYEVSDPGAGQKVFECLMAELNIPLRKTDNKVKRFYEKKMRTCSSR